MMTLREMINHVMNRGASLHVYGCICDTHYKGEKVIDVSNVYTAVIRTLLESGPSENNTITTDYQLLIRSVVAGEEEHTEVELWNNSVDEIENKLRFIDKTLSESEG